MKKVIVLSLILLITIATVTSVYAASNFEMKLKASKTELAKNEEFVVEAIISKIDFGEGIIALGGKLEYDTDSLELVKMEGGEHWATPSYNENNGKFITDRDSRGTAEETVFKITFKVKEQSKENVTIKLLDVSASNGPDEKVLEIISTSVTVKNGTSTPDDDPKPNTNTTPDDSKTNTNTNTNNNNNNNNNNTQNTNSNKNNNTNKDTNNSSNTNTNTNTNTNSNTNKNTNSSKNINVVNNVDNLKDGILPKAGATSIVFGTLGVMIIVAGIFYARIRIIDNKSKH